MMANNNNSNNNKRLQAIFFHSKIVNSENISNFYRLAMSLCGLSNGIPMKIIWFSTKMTDISTPFQMSLAYVLTKKHSYETPTFPPAFFYTSKLFFVIWLFVIKALNVEPYILY